MPRMKLVFAITEDRDSCVIELQEEDKALGHIIYDAATLDGVIRDLANCRRNLAEEVTPDLDPIGARLEVETGPAWRVPGTHSGPSDHVLLALRHPGLGWSGFLLEPDRARAIGQALLDQAGPKSNG